MDILLSEPVQALVAINVLLTLSLLFPFLAGVWSLGLLGFMAVGAYSAAYLTTDLGFSIAVSLSLGAVAGAAVTLPFGLLALRIRGIYLAIATLAAAELIVLFFSHFEPTGGVMGYTGMPYLGGGWLIVLALLALCASTWVFHSRLGKAMKAVGSDPVVASCNGINVAAIQLVSLGLGGALAGLAGACFAHFYSFVAPANFAFHRTVDILMFLVTGGLTPLGALAGASTLTLLPQYVTALERWAPAMYGVVVIAMMAWRPEGLIRSHRLFTWCKRRTLVASERRKHRSAGGAEDEQGNPNEAQAGSTGSAK